MIRSISFFISLSFLFFPYISFAFEKHKFPKSFFVEGLDISISEKELGFEGPHSILGAQIIVKRDFSKVLDETIPTSGYLQGGWITDLDNDKNPEIILWVRTHGTGGYGEILLFEVVEAKLIKHEFPSLTEEQKKEYGGHDQLTTSPSNIIRRYKIYEDNDPQCCPTGPYVDLIYSFDGKQIILQKYRRFASDLKPQKSKAGSFLAPLDPLPPLAP